MSKEDIYKKIYDSIKTTPYIPSISYPLNQTNIKRYLDATDVRYRHILKKLFDNTIHISYDKFQTSLYIQFESFIKYCNDNTITQISLFLDNIDKNDITQKSNFWVAQHFYQYLKTNNIKIKINIIYNKKDIQFLNDRELILILDDCSYTGNQLKSVLTKDFKSDYRVYNIYILIAYITEKAIKRITSTKLDNITLILSEYNQIIKNFFSYLTDDEIKLATLLLGEDKYPIYFDHKLADYISTYTEIYSGKIINSTSVIPVITNCEYINNISVIDMWKPKCPITPYKINSSDYASYEDKIKELRSLTTLSSIRDKEEDILLKYNEFVDKIPMSSAYIRRFIDKVRDTLKKSSSKFTSRPILKPESELFKIMQHPPLIPIFRYKLNSVKIEEYYSKIEDKKLQEIIKKIIDNIIYINYTNYISDLRDKIKELLKYLQDNNITTNIKLYIYDITSTNRWVSQILYHSFGEIQIEIIEDIAQIEEGDFVIYADDYIYTDNNIKPLLSLKINYKLYILTSYIIEDINIKLLKTISSSKKKYILLLSSDIKKVKTIDKYLLKEELDYLFEKTTFNFRNKYILYADHNIYNFEEGNALPILYGSIYNDEYLTGNKRLKFFSYIDNCYDHNLGTFIKPKCPRKIYEYGL